MTKEQINSYLTFSVWKNGEWVNTPTCKIGGRITCHRPTTEQAVAMTKEELLVYVAAETFTSRYGNPQERYKYAKENARAKAKMTRDEILKLFFNVGLSKEERYWKEMGF